MNIIIHDLTSAEAEGMFPDDKRVISDNGKIKSCTGCFGCWIKTPGKCVIRDGYENMGEILSKAEKVTVVSRLCYGGYSPFVKNVFDRSISYILPFFRLIDGETHHKPRYKDSFSLDVHFYGENITASEKDTAKEIVKANCVNLNVKEYSVDFWGGLSELREALK